RCFHEMLNTTPMQYVMETRLKKAAALLRSTNKSAKDIALDCGFNDTSYFTKMFRLRYDCTPGKYRKLL
ncbi:MAG: helix-turn-helix transcriptional regulator, partial [Lachnospiraceae bacterium]|nr:helix-turn-helix transcriptional regulator [Lachnospiraceae bacterium]